MKDIVKKLSEYLEQDDCDNVLSRDTIIKIIKEILFLRNEQSKWIEGFIDIKNILNSDYIYVHDLKDVIKEVTNLKNRKV